MKLRGSSGASGTARSCVDLPGEDQGLVPQISGGDSRFSAEDCALHQYARYPSWVVHIEILAFVEVPRRIRVQQLYPALAHVHGVTADDMKDNAWLERLS